MRITSSILLFLIFLLGCQHRQTSPAFPEYGNSGLNQIQVLVLGDVKQEGKYWIPLGTTLAEIEQIFGGSGGRGDFGGVGPLSVRLTRKINGEEVTTKYSLKNRGQLEMIKLQHGDRLLYPAVVF